MDHPSWYLSFSSRTIFVPSSSGEGTIKAIIVAGGGPYAGNNLWNATQMSVNFISDGDIFFPEETSVLQQVGPDIYEEDDSLSQANVIVLNAVQAQRHIFHDDGDVDWVDLPRYHTCLTGPQCNGLEDGCLPPLWHVPPMARPLMNCIMMDVDADGDVDLADFGGLQRVFQPE